MSGNTQVYVPPMSGSAQVYVSPPVQPRPLSTSTNPYASQVEQLRENNNQLHVLLADSNTRANAFRDRLRQREKQLKTALVEVRAHRMAKHRRREIRRRQRSLAPAQVRALVVWPLES